MPITQINTMKKTQIFRTCIAIYLCLISTSCINTGKPITHDNIFSWDNASLYFVYIDRFYNGNHHNDINYGRKIDYGNPTKNIATFHGGDIVGLTQKLNEGYFDKLGVDVLWITGIYEQIHGWVGGGSTNDFPHYAYHGYYPMDFTQMDKNFGTIEEFRTFVDAAHARNIRIVMDAGINHPGYQTLLDAVQYNFGGVDMTEAQATKHTEGLISNSLSGEHYNAYDYLSHFNFECDSVWENWWGNAWIRSKDEVDKDVLTESIFGLPDFRTESNTPVDLPPLYKNKWNAEADSNTAWINSSAVKYRTNLNIPPAEYIIKWLAAWVEEFGIDGFRCDVLDNVDTYRWKELNTACNQALDTWRQNNKIKPCAKWTSDFWMTGDIWDAGIEYYPNYASSGFASVVNFTFPKNGNLDSIGITWQQYANELNQRNNWSTVSFLNNTYKRDTQSQNMINCGTCLLLAPGAIQIFYGDEVGRQSVKNNASDPTHGYRGDYIWEQETKTLDHWQKLGSFRKKHISVGAGRQITIDKNTFARIYESDNIKDRVILKTSAQKKDFVNVGDIFKDGVELRNAYTNETSIVKDSKVEFNVLNNIILVEIAQ
ncbi:alpha-amylase [Labilibacter sediminis]|nr:alpha-amylase [Labilibacter sediminis]